MIVSTCYPLVACAAGGSAVPDKKERQVAEGVVEPASREFFSGTQSSSTETTIEQIGSARSGADQMQISSAPSDPRPIVEQLREYADRCADEQRQPQGLDCSELKLRMEKKLGSEDRLLEALTIIDTFARGGSKDRQTGGMTKDPGLDELSASAVGEDFLRSGQSAEGSVDTDLVEILGISLPEGQLEIEVIPSP